MEGIARGGLPARVDVQEFGGDIPCLFRSTPFRLGPLVGAEAVQRRTVLVGARVAGNQMQGRHWHVELGFLGVLDGQELDVVVVDGERLQPEIAADAMVDVHNGRSRGQLDEILDHEVRVDGTPTSALGGGFAAVAEDLRLRDHGDVVEPEATLDGRDGDAEPGVAGGEAREVLDVGPGQTFAAQEVVEVHLAARRLCRQEDARRRVRRETA